MKPTPDKLTPVYPLAMAARIVGCNPSTLNAWVNGRSFPSGGQKRRSPPVLAQGRARGAPLTFLDLVEIHVLHLIRKGYGIPIKNFRTAIEYLRSMGHEDHFLAHEGFVYDKKHLYLKGGDKHLVSLSERGQHINTTVISEGLKRLMYGEDGFAGQFFPTTEGSHDSKNIVIAPAIGYGMPAVASIGVSTEVIADRFQAGEHMADLAADYGATIPEIEDALRFNGTLMRGR
jgi:uncharacterized protein (DUF433 family)